MKRLICLTLLLSFGLHAQVRENIKQQSGLSGVASSEAEPQPVKRPPKTATPKK